MGNFRKILILVVAALLLVGMILAWGSIGSALLGFCLLMLVSALLVQRFVTNRDDDDFQEE